MKDKKAIATFLLITALLSTVFYIARIAGGESAAWVIYPFMWCPGIAALITKRIFYRHEKILGFQRPKMKDVLLAILIPVLYIGLSFVGYWIVDRDAFNGQVNSFPSPQFWISTALTFLLGLASTSVLALGEEIGWRGFLLPKMAGIWNVKNAVLVSGAIWSAWHFPLMLADAYGTGAPIWYQLPLFTAELVAMTAILAYFWLKSGSVWPAVFFHASHNVVEMTIFVPLATGDRIAYFAGETGIITVVIAAVIAAVLFHKLKRGERMNNVKE